MNWRCRIGLHKWVDVYRWEARTYFMWFPCGPGFELVAKKCRRCGKRRKV